MLYICQQAFAIRAFTIYFYSQFFQYPFGVLLLPSSHNLGNCRSYFSEVGPFAQVLALQTPFLHFPRASQNNTVVRSFSREATKLAVQPD